MAPALIRGMRFDEWILTVTNQEEIVVFLIGQVRSINATFEG